VRQDWRRDSEKDISVAILSVNLLVPPISQKRRAGSIQLDDLDRFNVVADCQRASTGLPHNLDLAEVAKDDTTGAVYFCDFDVLLDAPNDPIALALDQLYAIAFGCDFGAGAAWPAVFVILCVRRWCRHKNQD
jgi:hypothetical protein